MVINDGNNATSMFSESIVESLEGRVDGDGKEPSSFNSSLMDSFSTSEWSSMYLGMVL